MNKTRKFNKKFNNYGRKRCFNEIVVDCLKNLYLCIVKQWQGKGNEQPHRCENIQGGVQASPFLFADSFRRY